ncbi:hypothetical protein NE237_010059 [Protea cynaroides]|uniref:Uncharacterized protein n=1 Tax=Protea cynaroides TaxID=273540 RepID=A0A9Q0KZ18_9MAGN|nr:hypothetical protein NE237_010059 [Protea cynaroides]
MGFPLRGRIKPDPTRPDQNTSPSVPHGSLLSGECLVSLRHALSRLADSHPPIHHPRRHTDSSTLPFFTSSTLLSNLTLSVTLSIPHGSLLRPQCSITLRHSLSRLPSIDPSFTHGEGAPLQDRKYPQSPSSPVTATTAGGWPARLKKYKDVISILKSMDVRIIMVANNNWGASNAIAKVIGMETAITEAKFEWNTEEAKDCGVA